MSSETPFSPAITAGSSAASAAQQQPSTPTDPNITWILTDLQDSANNDDDIEPSAKQLKYIWLRNDQFECILSTCFKQQEVISNINSPANSVSIKK
jgi:hypothetical protein